MVASANIKTPSMEVPFLPNVSDKAKDALRISLNKVTLANVLEAVHVTEKIEMSKGCRKRLIKMRFEFLPKKQYKNQVCTRYVLNTIVYNKSDHCLLCQNGIWVKF